MPPLIHARNNLLSAVALCIALTACEGTEKHTDLTQPPLFGTHNATPAYSERSTRNRTTTRHSTIHNEIPPKVAILRPSNTMETSIDLRGTASNGVGVFHVTWVTDLGARGSAVASGDTKNASWLATGVPLHAGINTIRVIAEDSAGNRTSSSTIVTHIPSPTKQERTRAPVAVERLAFGNRATQSLATISTKRAAGTMVDRQGIPNVSRCGAATDSAASMRSNRVCEDRGEFPTGSFSASPVIEVASGRGPTDGRAHKNLDSNRGAPASCEERAAGRGPTDGSTYYFSDCQAGASADCVPGNDANAGTSPEAPKRTLAGINVNALPAGSRMLFKRGGAWSWTSIVRLDNRNVDAESPLTFAAYDVGAAPLLDVSSQFAFETGEWLNTVPDGGYVFRDLKFNGGLRGGGNIAIWLRGTVSDVLIENVEFTGFYIGLNGQGRDDIQRVTVRKSRFTRNTGMGVLGTFNNSLFEANMIDSNNFSGSAFDHGMYLSNMTNSTVRRNTFLNNSTVNGECLGGNLTVHGVVDGLIIENNRLYQQTSAATCFGISITTGHGNVAEVFRNVHIRHNVIVNLGGCAICLNAAPGALVENNLIINSTANPHEAIHIHGPEAGQIDHEGGGEIVRNNTACFALPERKTLLFLGTVGATQSGNAARTGNDAFTEQCRRRIAVAS